MTCPESHKRSGGYTRCQLVKPAFCHTSYSRCEQHAYSCYTVTGFERIQTRVFQTRVECAIHSVTTPPKPRSASFSSPLTSNENLWRYWKGKVILASCHQTISMKSLKGSQSTNSDQRTGLTLSSFITGLTVEEALFSLHQRYAIYHVANTMGCSDFKLSPLLYHVITDNELAGICLCKNIVWF